LEHTRVICDRCKRPTVKAERARVRWPASMGRRPLFDLCDECARWLAGELHVAPMPDAVAVPEPAA
jgi:RNase P subunit RPR2